MTIVHTIRSKIIKLISVRAFLIGLGLGAVLGLLVLVYVILHVPEQMSSLESRLAAQSVSITRGQKQTEDKIKTEHQTDLASSELHAEPLRENENNLDVYLLDPEKIKTSASLVSAPVSEFYEDSEFGLLPVIKPDGKTPFTIYKKPFTLNRDKPALAVAVIGYGLSETLSEMMVEILPNAVTFILSPYAKDPDAWQKKARSDGHEIWMQLLFETADFPKTDPGAMGLMSSVSIKYNKDRLYWALGRTTGYAGIAALTDQTLEKASPMFKTIASTLFQRGLGFFELNSSTAGFIEPLANEANIPAIRNMATLTNFSDDSADQKKIEELLKTSDVAIVSVIPTPANIPHLKTWLQSLEQSGVNLVPVSALAALSVHSNE